MKVKIYPSRSSGQIKIPPSKSMSHRALICAALAHGKSIISNIAYSDDIKITIECLKKLGVNIECYDDHVIVDGISEISNIKDTNIFCKESGSTLRFMLPVFSLTGQKIKFTGENRLLKRPQEVYRDIFIEQGNVFSQNESEIIIQGSIKSGNIKIRGDISSQFISGLLFALPLLKNDSTITIIGDFQSESYVKLTIQMLAKYGVSIELKDKEIFIKGNQKYHPCNTSVEGDYSQLGFFAVLGAINNDIECIGIDHDSLQGDKEIIDILRDFSCKVEYTDNGYMFRHSKPKWNQVDIGNCPDLGPILTVLMMFANGKSTIFNAKRLRLKESDRIDSMEKELLKCGVEISTSEDEISVKGIKNYYTDKMLDGHKDHRIVMSLSIAATMFDKPTVISDAESINKSYPSFFEDLAKLGIKEEIC